METRIEFIESEIKNVLKFIKRHRYVSLKGSNRISGEIVSNLLYSEENILVIALSIVDFRRNNVEIKIFEKDVLKSSIFEDVFIIERTVLAENKHEPPPPKAIFAKEEK